MPETMLKMAMKLGLAYCEDRNEVADTDNSLVENDPGTSSISNCGEFSKEFYLTLARAHTAINECRWNGSGASGNLFSLPDCLSDDCHRQSSSGESGATENGFLARSGFGVWRGIDRAS
jgi:hypothetical protein